MLSQLLIRNFAIAEHLELHFDNGMTVVSGETGAGKSIMIDALGLALGGRADSGTVRDQADKADISAVFDIADNPTAQRWLKAQDLDVADNDECIVRRVVNKDGRSRAFVNGQAIPVTQQKELGELLLHIHSQHAHQRLLRKETHRDMLDRFGNHSALLDQVAERYQQWQSTMRELANLEANREEQEARHQLLTYQVEELDQLGLAEGELATLEQEQERLTHADNILLKGHETLRLCECDEQGIVSQLSQALNLLSAIPGAEAALANTHTMLAEARIQVEESIFDLQQYLDSVEVNPQRLQEVEERLTLIYDLARKHRVDADALVSLHQQLQTELAQHEGGSDRLEALQHAVEQYHADYQAAADALTERRRLAAKKLDKAISHELKLLAMPQARFISTFHSLTKGGSAHGNEEVEFFLQANAGQPAQALAKVASGGELARVSLALQVCTLSCSKNVTMVFDEVDVGIGGATAEVVGRLLRCLSERGQVLCVTHQPQVAAQGNHHLHVRKQMKQNHTHSHIQLVEGKARVEEIARMLGGIELTANTLAHAEEMISLAKAS